MRTLTLLFLLLPVMVVAQIEPKTGDSSVIIPFVNGVVQFDTIVNVSGSNKYDIYKKVKLWAGKTFESAKYALQSDDKEGGLITYNFTNEDVGQSKFGAGNVVFCTLRWMGSINVFIKDGKVKLSISNLRLLYGMLTADKEIIPIQDYYKIVNVEARKGILFGSKKSKDMSYDLAVNTFNKSIMNYSKLLASFAEAVAGKSEFDF